MIVEFETREGGIFVRKSARGEHPVDQAFGVLSLDASVDDLVVEMRGPSPEDDRHEASRRVAPPKKPARRRSRARKPR